MNSVCRGCFSLISHLPQKFGHHVTALWDTVHRPTSLTGYMSLLFSDQTIPETIEPRDIPHLLGCTVSKQTASQCPDIALVARSFLK